MTETENKNFVKISWEDIDNYSVQLANRVRPLIENKQITRLCAITRGGLIPAALLARELDLRYIDTICVKSYDNTESQEMQVLKMIEGRSDDLLIVDEIAETGKTIEIIRKYLPDAVFVSLFATAEGKKHVDFYEATKEDNDWFIFPWENMTFKF